MQYITHVLLAILALVLGGMACSDHGLLVHMAADPTEHFHRLFAITSLVISSPPAMLDGAAPIMLGRVGSTEVTIVAFLGGSTWRLWLNTSRSQLHQVRKSNQLHLTLPLGIQSRTTKHDLGRHHPNPQKPHGRPTSIFNNRQK